MPIVNKGVLDSKDIFERLVGNDWPTTQTIFTNDVIESSSNLYYTNTRVQAYLDVQGYSTGGGGGGTDLSSNTTTDLAEGDNLYYTNARVESHVTTLGYATTSYVNSEVANLVASAPEALDTLNELAAALGDDENFASNVLTLISTKADTVSLTTANVAELTNLYYTNARVLAHIAASDLSVGGNLNVTGSLDTPDFSVSDTLTVGSQVIYAQGTNGFSVNEDFDPSSNSLQTAYHFTSGAGRETVAFTLARTNQFTNGFGIRGTSSDNKMVNFGEQNNTSFEWRKGVGIQPLNLGGGTLLANIQPNGDMYILGNVRAYQYLDYTGSVIGAGSGTDISSNTTTDLAEGNNLYYTNARVAAHVATLGYATGTDISSNTTTDLAEGNNLYYTNARVDSYINDSITTTDVDEGDNLYYTNARVLAHIAESNVSAQSFIATGAGTPTLTSQTNLVLSANADNGGAVVIQSSPLRIKSYTETDRGNITPATGDLIFNSTSNLLQVYNQVAWANVGSGVSGGIVEGANISANTTTDLAEGNNLYYTNTRVQAYLDEQGYSTGGGSTDLSSNTTTDLAEGDNLYYTNARARSAFTAGSGILINDGTIAADVNIPSEQSFDITIDNTVFSTITDSMESAFTTSSTSSYRHILKSLILTNTSESIATVNANVVYDGTEYEFANSLSIPYGFSVDLKFNPEVMMPGTNYKFEAAANDTVSLYVTYKTVEDISFVSETTALVADTYSTIYDSTDADFIVESIKICNLEGTNLRGTLQVKNSSDTVVSYIAANTLLAANYVSELLENPIRLPLGYKLSFISFSGRGTAIVSGRKSEAYTITSNVETISEGQSVTFTIATVNISDGATRYFRTSGNVSSADFNEGNTGSFTVLNDSATITLTANLDQSAGNDELGEQFQLVLAKTSTTGSAVATSNVISIIDTSNSVGVSSLTVSSNLIYESEATTITVDTINASGNAGATLYYTITGNADIYSNTSGAIIINDNTANLEIIAEASVPSDEVRSFAVQIRSGSVSGTILNTSDTIRVYSADTPGISATGGNQILEIDI